MDFGSALVALKEGKLVQRSGWNGKGMFIFMRPGDELPLEVVHAGSQTSITIQDVKSIPNSLKDYFADLTIRQSGLHPDQQQTHVKFTPYLCMKAADGSIVNGWLASQTDMLAEDWGIL